MTALLGGLLAAALLAGEPVRADAVARELDQIFAHERYTFCAADNDYVPTLDDQRWCELAANYDLSRCPGFARMCGRAIEGAEGSWSAPGEDEDEQRADGPGDVNRSAHEDEEPESFQLPDLGGFAKVLMWLLLIGLAIGVISVIVRNRVRDRSDDDPAPEPRDDASESLVAARIEALRVVETDVQRLLARADAAAKRGDHAAAIADLYAALLRRLEGARLISLDRWKTNGDYIHALRSKPALRDEVREVVREVEQVQFGTSPAAPERYADIRAAVLAIIGRTVLVLALAVGFGAHTACDKPDDEDAAKVSALAGLGSDPSGTRAVGELLLAFDIDARHRWRDIEQLAQTQGAIVLLDSVELEDTDWKRLLEWVEHDGGVLIIATGADFPREVGIDYTPGSELAVSLVAESSHAMFEGLDCVAPPSRTLTRRSEAIHTTKIVLKRRIVPFAALFGSSLDAEDELVPYVMRRALGQGQIFVFAESDMLTNAALLAGDNGTCLINLLRDAEVDEVEFVDMYTGAGADNPFDSVAKAKLGALFVQLLLFLALLYAMVGLPFARLRDPPAQRRRAFVEHVRTLGQRYAQARAVRHVAVHYCSWALDRLRARLQPGSARGLHPLAVAIAARTGRSEAEVMQILVEAHELRESDPHSNRGGPSELASMRRLSELLAQIVLTPGGPG
jgi:hypothetical protein